MDAHTFEDAEIEAYIKAFEEVEIEIDTDPDLLAALAEVNAYIASTPPTVDEGGAE